MLNKLKSLFFAPRGKFSRKMIRSDVLGEKLVEMGFHWNNFFENATHMCHHDQLKDVVMSQMLNRKVYFASRVCVFLLNRVGVYVLCVIEVHNEENI